MANRKKPQSEHRILPGAQSFCEAVLSLPGVTACDQNKINPQSSSLRGVSLRLRKYDLEAVFHSDDGMQWFYIKPSKATPVEMLLSVVQDRLQKRYNILEVREVNKLRERRTTRDEMKQAHEALWKKAKVDEDGQRRITGVMTILNEMFEKKKAASIQATLTKKVMKAESQTMPDHGRKTTIYIVTKPEWIEDEPVPAEPTAATSVQSELTDLLLLNPALAAEILENLWQAKTEKLEKSEQKRTELQDQREEIDKQINDVSAILLSLPEEIKHVEELLSRLHQQCS